MADGLKLQPPSMLLTRPGTETARYTIGIAAAITFNLIGGQFAPGTPAPRRSLFGVSATAICYLLFASATAQYGPAIGGVRLLAVSLCLLVAALAGPTILLRTRRQDPVQAAVAAVYTLILSVAAGLAFGLAFTASRFGVLAAGTLLLVISDLNLLVELTSSPSIFPHSPSSAAKSKSRLMPSLSSAARLLRSPGQALIVVSIWSALQNPLSLQFSILAP